MRWANAVFPQGFEMCHGRIPHVAIETIVRILGVKLEHIGVATRLGQYGRRSDRRYLAVAPNYALCRTWQLRAVIAVNQSMVWWGSKQFHSAAHGEQAGLEDIDEVDLLDRRLGNRPSQCVVANFDRQCCTALGRQLFGVIKSFNRVRGIEDHRSGDNRAGQRATPGLVYTADQTFRRQ